MAQFFERDQTNDFFSQLTLDTLHEDVSQYCALHEGVPVDIRDYFSVVVTLYLYGWFYYPFYTLASERSLFAVEMALRKRLPPIKLDKKGCDPRNLKDLFSLARTSGLLSDEGFPSLNNRRANSEQWNKHIPETLGSNLEPQSEIAYVDVLIGTFPTLRNCFAHPALQNILIPGQALDGLILAAEIINQLWPNALAK